MLARALVGCHRFDEAELEFRHALQLRSGDSSAHIALAELIWLRTGDVMSATAGLDDALRKNSDLVALRVAKARLMSTCGDTINALATLELGLGRAPDDVHLRLAAAQTVLGVDPPRALAHAEHAFKSAPRQSPVVAIYGDALFAAGRIADAEKVATHGLAINPDDNHSIALLGSAWRATGNPRQQELSDYTNFIRATPLDTPAGWASLSDYVKDLASSLDRLHQYNAHPVDQSLRSGSQVDVSPAFSDDPVIRAFAQAIDGPIRRYMHALGRGPDVLRRRNTMNYRLNGVWSVRLRPLGHHLNHFHGQGWLSSACYIKLPPSLGKEGAGWLKFGEPSFASPVELGPEYILKPEEGLLALFPSWMWHGTVPFTGALQDRRLTMAFDVLPA